MGGQCRRCLYTDSSRRDTPHQYLINADGRVSWPMHKILMETANYLKPLVLWNIYLCI